MEQPNSPVRFKLGKQSSLAPERGEREDGEDGVVIDIDPRVRLMYSANEADIEGIKELLECGTDVNFRDIDKRTALHVAACQGSTDVVQLLLDNGAQVDPKDRWGSTPLADAIHYKNHEVIKLLEKHGAKPPMAPMHVNTCREVPEYEIDAKELDFTNSIELSKGTFHIALWRGIQVAVKKFGEDVIADEDKVRAFRDELALLQKIRHPNVVQFLGAVTQSSPMMIVTEYLPKGDLRQYLNRKGALKPTKALRFAMDIARGLNYLHEHKEAIIHRDLEPSNILRDDTGHLKVADFGVSKLLKVTSRVKEDKPLTYEDSYRRYVAPEVFRNEEYDTKVDVFSFALILQEMIEGYPPFHAKEENDVPKLYAAKERPPFKAPAKFYAHGLKELIEECWSDKPAKRPSFKQIIPRLESIYKKFDRKNNWTVIRPLRCFQHLEAMWKKDTPNLSSRNGSSRSTCHI
ncbi:PREDICTED: serine/threonine-protein kinase HT1-like [Nicotiana attenuata]|uniref:Serinethreonine-protein kinase sty8 n=1 Tax=Nicotiana attenuata TaxID=49451 RepID=A0A1J6IKN8_NICAT|nr:PREDICTED: serine/threonine-protein kinase HT1-like [Nicotiana attenuata]OIS98286.1 serinethreonine-protein kinase sty8 [Nicotiana attenuata]